MTAFYHSLQDVILNALQFPALEKYIHVISKKFATKNFTYEWVVDVINQEKELFVFTKTILQMCFPFSVFGLWRSLLLQQNVPKERLEEAQRFL